MTHELKPRILVFGVGGAGGNAVDNMIEANLQGVEFIVANTDAQALFRSKTDQRIQLGPETTSGLGAGARPDVGAKAAEESIDEIKMYLEGAHMVFIAAGMGGGTGTGAAPVIARTAQEMGILTVAVVTKPFGFEGARRMSLADQGLLEIREHVDTMIVVPNQNLFRIANDRTTFAEAFRMADDVLYSGVRGITDLMVMPGLINLDFADVGSIMRGMGTAMMGMGEAEGENRALEAARAAIDNPLLDDVSLKGARGVLINITGGYDMTLFELDEAASKIRVSVVAAGIETGQALELAPQPVQQTVRQPIAEPIAEEIIQPETASDEDRPLVITGHSPSLRSEESDPRSDFSGQPLPADHYAGAEGSDEVSADAVFGSRKETPAPDKARPDQGASGFSHLFGWRRSQHGENDDAPEAAIPAQIISSPDDHPEAAPFDDADLEIPAFLRRSANH
jgi:cell division protein FtsZ